MEERKSTKLTKVEEAIAKDKKGFFTILAVFSAVVMFINSVTLSSQIIGALLTVSYFAINSIFLGHIFFQEETAAFRTAFGFLVAVMLVALCGATVIVASGFLPVKFDAQTTIVAITVVTVVVSITDHIKTRTKSRLDSLAET